MKVVRKSEFARMEGLSPGRISQYIRDGILSRCLLPDGRLDLEEAKRELRANRDPLKRQDYELRSDVKKAKPKFKPQGRKTSHHVWSEDLGILLDFGPYLTKKGKVKNERPR